MNESLDKISETRATWSKSRSLDSLEEEFTQPSLSKSVMLDISKAGLSRKDYKDTEKDNLRLRQVTVETEALGMRLAKEIQQLRFKAKNWEKECKHLALALDHSVSDLDRTKDKLEKTTSKLYALNESNIKLESDLQNALKKLSILEMSAMKESGGQNVSLSSKNDTNLFSTTNLEELQELKGCVLDSNMMRDIDVNEKFASSEIRIKDAVRRVQALESQVLGFESQRDTSKFAESETQLSECLRRIRELETELEDFKVVSRRKVDSPAYDALLRAQKLEEKASDLVSECRRMQPGSDADRFVSTFKTESKRKEKKSPSSECEGCQAHRKKIPDLEQSLVRVTVEYEDRLDTLETRLLETEKRSADLEEDSIDLASEICNLQRELKASSEDSLRLQSAMQKTVEDERKESIEMKERIRGLEATSALLRQEREAAVERASVSESRRLESGEACSSQLLESKNQFEKMQLRVRQLEETLEETSRQCRAADALRAQFESSHIEATQRVLEIEGVAESLRSDQRTTEEALAACQRKLQEKAQAADALAKLAHEQQTSAAVAAADQEELLRGIITVCHKLEDRGAGELSAYLDKTAELRSHRAVDLLGFLDTQVCRFLEQRQNLLGQVEHSQQEVHRLKAEVASLSLRDSDEAKAQLAAAEDLRSMQDRLEKLNLLAMESQRLVTEKTAELCSLRAVLEDLGKKHDASRRHCHQLLFTLRGYESLLKIN